VEYQIIRAIIEE